MPPTLPVEPQGAHNDADPNPPVPELNGAFGEPINPVVEEDPPVEVPEPVAEEEPFHGFEETTTTLRRSSRPRKPRQFNANEAILNGI